MSEIVEKSSNPVSSRLEINPQKVKPEPMFLGFLRVIARY
jgi:hypothetical protein